MSEWFDVGFPFRGSLIRIKDVLTDNEYVLRAELPGMNPEKDERDRQLYPLLVAVRELLDRTVGQPVEADAVDDRSRRLMGGPDGLASAPTSLPSAT